MLRACFKTAIKIPARKQFPNRYFSNLSANSADNTIPITFIEKTHIESLKKDIFHMKREIALLDDFTLGVKKNNDVINTKLISIEEAIISIDTDIIFLLILGCTGCVAFALYNARRKP
jgi:hypothetical protein